MRLVSVFAIKGSLQGEILRGAMVVEVNPSRGKTKREGIELIEARRGRAPKGPMEE